MMMMRSSASPPLLLLAILAMVATSSASIFLPGVGGGGVSRLPPRFGAADLLPSDDDRASSSSYYHRRRCLDRAVRNSRRRSSSFSSSFDGRSPFLAMAIPGNSLPEQIIIGGFGNFISIYNAVITGRILLSWFPQAAGVGALRPIYQITDPYLNLFRGIIPPIFGLDLSPILAFVTLNLLQSSSVSLAATIEDYDIADGGVRAMAGGGWKEKHAKLVKWGLKTAAKDAGTCSGM
ncbi:hypothetical protein ACHAW5_007446 [Stephanodiscus triporus]|uniref:Uncharacterized protein n=1 Tax=Stephanodiscus triporus TaxID=2934178 RepID=A0ABD3PJY1_9STRA